MTRHRTVGALLLASTFLIAGASAAAASSRWTQNAVIPVWIDAVGMPSGAGALVELALKTWTEAAAGRFKLWATAATRDAAAIRIHFLRADGVYGETAPQIDARTLEIVEADVLINGDAAGNGTEGRIVVYLTALHEIGHALGLGHTDDFDRIMYRFQRPDDGARFFGKYRALLRSADDIGSKQATGLLLGGHPKPAIDGQLKTGHHA